MKAHLKTRNSNALTLALYNRINNGEFADWSAEMEDNAVFINHTGYKDVFLMCQNRVDCLDIYPAWSKKEPSFDRKKEILTKIVDIANMHFAEYIDKE